MDKEILEPSDNGQRPSHWGKWTSLQNGQHKTILFTQEFPLLDLDPRELKSYVHTKACTQTFTAALCHQNSQSVEPPKSPPIDEGEPKQGTVQTVASVSHQKALEYVEKCVSMNQP